jgi:hypothetical protein
MNAFTITLRHDRGSIAIQAIGISERAAIDKVLQWQLAPESAVLSVQDHGPIVGQADNAGRD